MKQFICTFYAAGILISLKLALMTNILLIKAQKMTVSETIGKLNFEYNIKLNIFLNMKDATKDHEGENFFKMIKQPKLIFQQTLDNISAISRYTTGSCLTIARMDINNMKDILNNMAKLLWRLHFTDILIIWQTNELENKDDDLNALFKECWKKGHTNVIVWLKGYLLTYTPYPKVEKVHLDDFEIYRHKLHLYNFQKYAWKLPFVELAPRCFSYRDQQGNLIRTGYMYKMIDLFISHLNGSLNIDDVNMWAPSVSKIDVNQFLNEYGYAFLPVPYYINDYMDHSDGHRT